LDRLSQSLSGLSVLRHFTTNELATDADFVSIPFWPFGPAPSTFCSGPLSVPSEKSQSLSGLSVLRRSTSRCSRGRGRGSSLNPFLAFRSCARPRHRVARVHGPRKSQSLSGLSVLRHGLLKTKFKTLILESQSLSGLSVLRPRFNSVRFPRRTTAVSIPFWPFGPAPPTWRAGANR